LKFWRKQQAAETNWPGREQQPKNSAWIWGWTKKKVVKFQILCWILWKDSTSCHKKEHFVSQKWLLH